MWNEIAFFLSAVAKLSWTREKMACLEFPSPLEDSSHRCGDTSSTKWLAGSGAASVGHKWLAGRIGERSPS